MAQDIETTLDSPQADNPATVPHSKVPAAPASTTSNETVKRADETLDLLDSLQAELRADALEPAKLDYELPPEFLLSIVVPAYNEENTIAHVVESLYRLDLPIEVIVVDDGSSDGTCAVLTRLNEKYSDLRVILQERNQGKGAALRRGFEVSRGSHVMVQDADLEYNPQQIPELLGPLARDEADVVYGSRFLEKRWEGSSFVHRFGNRALTAASNLVTGLHLTDMETCYKIVRRNLLSSIDLEQNRFGFEVELTARLAQMGARMVELPITYEARGWEEGKKIGWRDAVQALYCIVRYAIR